MNRAAIERLTTEVRHALNDIWDPIGVYHSGDGLERIDGWPEDEYDSYVGPVVSMLIGGASDRQIQEYLSRVVTESMELTPSERRETETIAALRKISVSRE